MYIYRRKNRAGEESGPYWLCHWRNGKRHRETTATESRDQAEQILAAVKAHKMTVAEMLTEYASLKPRLKAFEMLFPAASSTLRDIPTVGLLLDSLLKEYEVNGRKSTKTARQVIDKNLRPAFGTIPATELTTEMMRSYCATRKTEGLQPITINNQLTLLRAAMFSAKRGKVIADLPHFPMLPNAKKRRQGFFTEEEFTRFCFSRHTPQWLATLATAAKLTGFRRGELIRLDWRNVDLTAKPYGWLKLEAGTTKNNDARTSPILPRLLPVLVAQFEYTQTLQAQKNEIIPCVFHKDGKRLDPSVIRIAWDAACKASGLRKKFHDLRRTFRRSLEEAGIDPNTGMSLMGQKDRDTYYGYQPVVGQDKIEAVTKLERVVSQ